MTNLNQTVMTEAMATIAQHYADKMIKNGLNPTQEEVAQAMQNNWEKVSKEISELYATVMNQMEAA